MTSKTSVTLPHPFYADHVLYHAVNFRPGLPTVRAWEFNGWRKEALSWRKSCYIHAGLSGTGPVSIRGPEAKKYLQSILINSLEKFPIGSMKHGVMCSERGLVAAHGIIERKGEDFFESWAGGPPAGNLASAGSFDVEVKRLDYYLFQIAGPASLHVLEKVTGESLRDVAFLRFRDTSINGIRTEIGRIGMTGGLAYELHGPMEDAEAVYDAVYKAGLEFGIERLGWGTYLVNHVEGGFPQYTWTLIYDFGEAQLSELKRLWHVSGSVDPDNLRARMRTPVEVGWDNMAKFDHDFVGSGALRAEIANPKRRTVTLRWNPEDVMDTYASLLRQGDAYVPVDIPYSPQRWPMAHADHIIDKKDREVGYSSGTIYSYYFREFLSLGCLDVEASALNNEVVVQWGDYGGPIKRIRATVAPFPYLAQGRNNQVDVRQLTN